MHLVQASATHHLHVVGRHIGFVGEVSLQVDKICEQAEAVEVGYTQIVSRKVLGLTELLVQEPQG